MNVPPNCGLTMTIEVNQFVGLLYHVVNCLYRDFCCECGHIIGFIRLTHGHRQCWLLPTSKHLGKGFSSKLIKTVFNYESGLTVQSNC